MKSSDFRGFKSVFKFTMGQSLKQKSLIVTFVILLLFSLAMPVISKLKNNKKVIMVDTIDKVYLINETNLANIPLSDMAEDYGYMNAIEVIETNDSVEKICEMLEDEEKTGEEKKSVLIHATIDPNKGGYVFTAYYSADSKVDSDDLTQFTSDINAWFNVYKASSMDVSDDALELIKKPIKTVIIEYDDYVATEKEAKISMTQYNMIYIVLMVFFMVINFASSMVANKIAEEKSNRIVEYLLTTVRPMALIVGKIAATVLIALVQILLIGVGLIASSKVANKLFPAEGPVNSTESFFSLDALKGMNIGTLLLCLLFLFFGVVIFCFISGLFAASVTKMEELQQTLKIYTFILMLSFFAAFASVMIMLIKGVNGYVKFTMILPLTSTLIVPGALLIGQATVAEVVVSLILLAVTAVALLWFVSVVYENVIVSNGGIVSFKTMFSMAKGSLGNKKGGKTIEKK